MKEYLDEFKRIPYELQTPSQRWAVICAKERKRKDWVRREMAQYFGVVTSTVTFWEQAHSYPKNEYIYKMAQLIKVEPNELINHLNNTQQLKQSELDIKPSNKIIETAKTLSKEELGNVIQELVKLLVSANEHQHCIQLSLGL